MTRLTFETLVVDAALPGPENPLPVFRDPAWDRTVRLVEPVAPEYRQGLGKDAGYRVLPYGRQDSYTRLRKPHPFRAAVLENSRLRAVFLPELGGRLVSLVDRASGRELLYRNPCVQVANLAVRDAWFSGGIEWNIGPFGHACHTCSPVFAGRTRTPDGAAGLRIGEFERTKGLFWQIDFRLSETEPVLWAHVTVTNPLDHPVPMYWWTNIAVPETPGCRVVAPADEALCLMPSQDGTHTFAQANLPGLPSLAGRDGTYAQNYRFANEFFFLCPPSESPWEAVVDAQGRGMFEASTRTLPYRKLFVWGTHPGGQRWQDYLAPQGGGTYLEIQAGLAPTQLHGLPIPAGATWTWTEAFGPLSADPVRAHGADWTDARSAVAAGVRSVLPEGRLEGAGREGAKAADWPLVDVLLPGSPWGALEQKRLERAGSSVPARGLAFAEPGPQTPAGPWDQLLTQGTLPDGDRPPAWMVQAEWGPLLEASLSRPGGDHAGAWLAWGTFCLEAGDAAGADRAWAEAWDRGPSLWAARNRAVLARRENDAPGAMVWYRRALGFPETPVELVREALEFLVNQGTPQALDEAGSWLDRWPSSVRQDDRIGILTARWHLARGDGAAVLDLLGQGRDWAYIREGELSLPDLWIQAHAGLLARDRNSPITPELRAEAERLHPVPASLDFRMG
jgi:hypothetical protein